jgi:hypothetical protein
MRPLDTLRQSKMKTWPLSRTPQDGIHYLQGKQHAAATTTPYWAYFVRSRVGPIPCPRSQCPAATRSHYGMSSGYKVLWVPRFSLRYTSQASSWAVFRSECATCCVKTAIEPFMDAWDLLQVHFVRPLHAETYRFEAPDLPAGYAVRRPRLHFTSVPFVYAKLNGMQKSCVECKCPCSAEFQVLMALAALCWIADPETEEALINGYRRGVSPKHRHNPKFRYVCHVLKET